MNVIAFWFLLVPQPSEATTDILPMNCYPLREIFAVARSRRCSVEVSASTPLARLLTARCTCAKDAWFLATEPCTWGVIMLSRIVPKCVL